MNKNAMITIYGCPEHSLPGETSRIKVGVTLDPKKRFNDMLGHRPDLSLTSIHQRNIILDTTIFRPTGTSTFLVNLVDGKNIEPDEFIHKLLRLKGYKTPDKGSDKGKHKTSEVFVNLLWAEVSDLITLAITHKWDWNKCRKAVLLNKPSLNLYIWQAWNIARRKDTRFALPDEAMIAEYSCPRFGKTTRELYEFWESDDTLLILVQYNLSAVTSFFNELDTYCEFADIEKYDLTDAKLDVSSLPVNLTSGKKVIAISLCGDAEREKYNDFVRFVHKHADPSRTRIEMDEVDFGAVTEKSKTKMDKLKTALPGVKINIFSGTGEDKVNFKMDMSDRVRASAIRTSYVELLHIRAGKHYIFTPQHKASLDPVRNKHEIAFLNGIPTTNYYATDRLVEPTFYSLRVDPEVLREIDKVHTEKGDDDPRLGFSYNKINRNPVKYASVHQSIWKKFLGIGALKGCQLDYLKCTRGKQLRAFMAWVSAGGGMTKKHLRALAEVLNNDPELAASWVFAPVCGEVKRDSKGHDIKWGAFSKGGTPATNNKKAEEFADREIDRAKAVGKGVVFLAMTLAQRSFSVSRIDGVVFYRDDLPVESADQKLSRVLTPGVDYFGNPKKIGHIFNLSLTPNSSLIENYIYSEINEQARNGISAKVAASRLFEVINVWEMNHLGEMIRKDSFTDADFSSYSNACRTMYARSEVREMVLGMGNMDNFLEVMRDLVAHNKSLLNKKDRDTLRDMVDNAAGSDATTQRSNETSNNDEEPKQDTFTQGIMIFRRLLYESVLNMAAIYCAIKNLQIKNIEKDNVQYSTILKGIRDNSLALSIFTSHYGLSSENISKKFLACILNSHLDDKLTANLHAIILETAFGKDIQDTNLSRYFYANTKEGKIHTPMRLVNEMMTKWEGTVKGDVRAMKYLDPHCKTGTFLRWIHTMLKERGVSEIDIQKQVEGVENDPVYVAITRHLSGIENIQYKNLQDDQELVIFKDENMKKFDVIVGNPPYNPDKGEAAAIGGKSLWPEFVNLGLDILKENGYLCMIHPCGWRNAKGKFSSLRDLMLKKQIHYLEIHSADDGAKTFGVSTRHDWYVLQNTPCTKATIVRDEDGNVHNLMLSKMPFIPNGMYKEIENLIAKDGEEKVEILANSSYHVCRTDVTSRAQVGDFKYPIIYTIRKDGLNLIYANRNDKGHFGVPKVVFGRGQSNTYVDAEGKYGISESVRAIIDDVKNLDQINKALNSPCFIELSSYCNFISTGMFRDKYNKDALALFRKDFWKDFQDDAKA